MAKIESNTVKVWSEEVNKSVAMRFDLNNLAESNRFNKAGLPASSFRADNWKVKNVENKG
ncbi:hypothetical protein D1614_21720 [Maribellus luteus]|uniref:Uncharacterized protein n=1 Tax=Maribellus luteus TaxID=2305463 RepID=A0A399SUV3_9BACT|nr:hypothetical protein [Maribellus luteus]RIJ45757.1 hypothetical protein D1614_21720 [Maribellus luteus]